VIPAGLLEEAMIVNFVRRSSAPCIRSCDPRRPASAWIAPSHPRGRHAKIAPYPAAATLFQKLLIPVRIVDCVVAAVRRGNPLGRIYEPAVAVGAAIGRGAALGDTATRRSGRRAPLSAACSCEAA
jgi:hypothetical protein